MGSLSSGNSRNDIVLILLICFRGRFMGRAEPLSTRAQFLDHNDLIGQVSQSTADA